MNWKIYFKHLKNSLFIVLLLQMLSACEGEVFDKTPEPVQICDTLKPEFTKHIQPLIVQYCVCHDANSSNGDFTSYIGLKAKIDNGKFEQRFIIDKNMPPSGVSQPTSDEYQKILCWFENGADNN